MNRKTLLVLAAFVVMFMVSSGCASTTRGTTAGTGGDTWVRGKLTFSTRDTLTECHDATLYAFMDLGIKVEGDTTTRQGGRIMGETTTGESVIVDLIPQGLTTTKLEVRVGVIGNEGQSKIIADSIRRHL